jgi:hypothetical protein
MGGGGEEKSAGSAGSAGSGKSEECRSVCMVYGV